MTMVLMKILYPTCFCIVLYGSILCALIMFALSSALSIELLGFWSAASAVCAFGRRRRRRVSDLGSYTEFFEGVL